MAVYLGELREVRAPSLGPHGAWAVLEPGDSYPNAGPPVDRLAYVVQLRDVRQCTVAPCLTENKPRLQEWDAFVDARTGRASQAIGLPKGYSGATG